MKKPTILLTCFLLTMLFGAGLMAAQSSPPAKSSKTPAASQSTGTGAANAPAATNTQPGAFSDQKSKASYAIGLNIGKSMRIQSVDVDPNVLLQGLKDGLAGGKALLTDDEVRATMQELQTQVRARMEEKRRQEGEANKKESDAFLAANKAKEGVQFLPSGLQYKVVTQGTGPKPTASDTVACNYRGTLIDGTEFDSSSKHGGPVTFPVSGVIKGWTEALQLMPTGSKWQLFIPADLAYGDQPPPGANIPPGATLIFDIELVSIQPKQ